MSIDKKTESSMDRRAAKRAAVLQPKNKSRLPLAVCLILLVLAPFGAYIILGGADSTTGSPETMTAESTSVPGKAEADRVTYPVALFDDGQARHFVHVADDIAIRYFILKSADGVVRAAFDACDVCWPAGKGYAQEGDVMVCRNCGRRFASVRINEVKGGCNPAPLKRSIEGDRLVLRVEDIFEGAPYFNFKGKA